MEWFAPRHTIHAPDGKDNPRTSFQDPRIIISLPADVDECMGRVHRPLPAVQQLGCTH